MKKQVRYLAIAWDSGAKPVIVLTKSDLCEELSTKLWEIREVAIGVDIIVTSSMKDDGLNSKEIEKEKIDNMYSSFDGIKNARNYIKSKSKRK